MQEALYIIKTLNSNGYISYFAGGWVRDYLLDHPSEDIDIASNAPPEVVESLFPHTIPIGKAFGIILVIIKNKQYEVATFRHDIEYKDGRRPSKIEFSSPEIDSKRRDFTINGMFYDPMSEEIIDYVNGREDLSKKIIRCIGNAHTRFREDRLRMIRAVRMSARFNFEIEKETKRAITTHAEDLFPSIAIERIWQELTKMSQYQGFKKALIMLFEFNLLQTIFPGLKNLSLDEVSDRLSIIDDFPHRSPVIVSILELFPEFGLEQKQDLCRYLKLSNRQVDFVTFLHNGIYYIKNENKIDDHSWAYFYANHFYELVIDILAIHVKAEKRKDFLLKHEKKQKVLQKYIDRIKNNDPLLKSDHLKLCNVKPGILMGQLLKEGEKISINKKLTDPHKIIEELKKMKFWPKK
ncbi:MAG: CCA-adding enzyme [Candidatus Anoxychlamydiales bacterium]|nr:CCA-adding enzyme [Candidatus Anoxychlamydiales bacterium]NGX36147.1 CCA-adding enzyme [Candidatus Anoxychlamydiales bacterium]